MRIFDETKTIELSDIDETLGYLKPDVLITHHAAVPAVAGQSHYEVIREYLETGGKDVVEIWDKEPIEGKEAYDEYEDIQVFIPYTAEMLQNLEKTEKIQQLSTQIENLKTMLSSWDYKTSKHADGDYTDEEWKAIVAQRKAWRAEINSLEAQLDSMK